MIKILLWVFIAYGMSTIITGGAIFERPRLWIMSRSTIWGDFISCMLCVPTWCGFFLSLVTGGLVNEYLNFHGFGFFFDGMFTAGSVWALNAIIEFFEESRIN